MSPKKLGLKIMGVDPGSHLTGVGIIHAVGDDLSYVHHQLLRTTKTSALDQRISEIFDQLTALCVSHRPDIVVVEQVFFGKNADSAFKLGHARGVVLLAARRSGARVLEVSARGVKKILTGSGAASKEQVREMLCRWLKVDIREQEMDVSDALSLAIAGSFEYERSLRMSALGRDV